MFINDKEKGLVFKNELIIYQECLDKTFYDSEIESLLPELYRITEHFYNINKDFIKNQYQYYLINALIRDFKKIVRENKEEYVSDVIDLLITNNTDWEIFPYHFEAICFPNMYGCDAYLSLLASISLSSEDIRKKNYKHPFIKILNYVIQFSEYYRDNNRNISKFVFLVEQLCYLMVYFYKNNIWRDDLYNIFTYIYENIDRLHDYDKLNLKSSEDINEEYIMKKIFKILHNYQNKDKSLNIK